MIHVALLFFWLLLPERSGFGPAPTPEPIVLNLQTEQEARQLVSVREASETPPEETRHIAETHSLAADRTLKQGDTTGPSVEVEDTVAVLETPPVAPMPEPVPEQEQQVVEEPVEEARQESHEDTSVAVEEEVVAQKTPAVQELKEVETAPEAQEVEEKPAATEQPMQVAKATSPPPTPPQEPPRRSRGRKGGAHRKGVTNFAAIEDEIAPYLKKIQRRVEREWNAALLTRYSGTSPVRVEIECAISPEGEVVSVVIMGTPKDRVYAALCKDAIERAGPFGAFTFDVPPIYQNQNLEIRWTFSFL